MEEVYVYEEEEGGDWGALRDSDLDWSGDLRRPFEEEGDVSVREEGEYLVDDVGGDRFRCKFRCEDAF